MRAKIPANWERGRIKIPDGYFPGEWTGMYSVTAPNGASLRVMVSDGAGWNLPGPHWEHASVSCPGRGDVPTWEEMCWVKDQLWYPEACVVQYHPPESQYVNDHPYVLHLWRCPGQPFPMPPKECV